MRNSWKKAASISLAAMMMTQISLTSFAETGIDFASDETAAKPVELSALYFADKTFMNIVADNFDFDGDGVISVEEQEEIGEDYILDIGEYDGMSVYNLDGINFLTWVSGVYLENYCGVNIDLSNNTSIKYLDIYAASSDDGSNININLAGSNVETLYECESSNVTYTFGDKLTDASFEFSGVESIDFTKASKLAGLDIYECPELTSLDLSGCSVLGLRDEENDIYNDVTVWYCDSLTSVITPPNATDFSISECTALTTLNTSKSTKLKVLAAEYCALKSLDLTKNTALTELYVYGNQLTSLGITKNTALEYLDCSENKLTGLNTSYNKALTHLACAYNSITALSLTNNTNLVSLDVEYNSLSKLDISKLTKLKYLYYGGNTFTSVDMSKMPQVLGLGVSGMGLTALDLSKYPDLEKLKCGNNKLTALDLSKTPNLEYLICINNQLKSLDLSKLPYLYFVNARKNNLTEFTYYGTYGYTADDDKLGIGRRSRIFIDGNNIIFPDISPALDYIYEAFPDISREVLLSADLNEVTIPNVSTFDLNKYIPDNLVDIEVEGATLTDGVLSNISDKVTINYSLVIGFSRKNVECIDAFTTTLIKGDFTVLEAPANVAAVASAGKVDITWDAVDDATSYRVFRADSATGEKTLLKTRTSCNYTDTAVEAGKTYYYFVAAYNANTSELSDYSAYAVATVPNALKAPVITSATASASAVTIAWNAVDDATSYRVYRADSATGTKTLLKTRTSCNYTDTTVEAGKTYYYFVAAYNANTTELSDYSAAASVTVYGIDAPAGVQVVTGGGNATITWNAVADATSYRVFRSTSLTGARTLVKVRTSTYFIDTTVDTGSTYYYWIVSYNANTGLKSAYSSAVSAKIVDTFDQTPAIKSVSITSKTVTLTWDVIPGATSYRIYRRNDDGTRKLLASQSMTEFKDTGLTKGKIYKYEIRAYSATTKALTPYSSIKNVRPMAAPTIMTGNVLGKITWDKNMFATSYRVYRADSLTGPKKLLAPTTLTYYTDTTAVDGKTYYYFVAGYDNVTGTLTAFSNAKAITINK